MTITPIASGSKGNAYLIESSGFLLLLEAGLPIKQLQRGTGWRLSELSGCLVSHEHDDHAHAVPELLAMGVDVYAPSSVFAAKGVSGHRCNAIEPMKTFRIDIFNILPFHCEHDVPCYGYLIMVDGKRILFFTDTYYLRYRFEGITHIMGECNFSEAAMKESVAAGLVDRKLANRIEQSHMSLERLLEMLGATDLSNVEQIYLLHLSDINGREQEFKQSVQETTGREVYVC